MYTHNNNHQQVRNNSYLMDRDKTGHNYREISEISDRLFNSVNPSLHELLLSGSQ